VGSTNPEPIENYFGVVGGEVIIVAGNGPFGGYVSLEAGDAIIDGGIAGNILLEPGKAAANNTVAGDVIITGGGEEFNPGRIVTPGNVQISGGTTYQNGGGDVIISGGDSGQGFAAAGSGGNVTIRAGQGTAGVGQVNGAVFLEGNVNINGNLIGNGAGTPTLSSATNLDLSANVAVRVTGGATFRLPSLTTAQIANLIATNGDLIYNTTVNKIQGFENGAWGNLI
jgi:hypothetical protein